jgi:hypothetical protein
LWGLHGCGFGDEVYLVLHGVVRSYGLDDVNCSPSTFSLDQYHDTGRWRSILKALDERMRGDSRSSADCSRHRQSSPPSFAPHHKLDPTSTNHTPEHQQHHSLRRSADPIWRQTPDTSCHWTTCYRARDLLESALLCSVMCHS